MFVIPSATLPVHIGEFGPVSGYMTQADTEELMKRAKNLSLPWTSWTFHHRCPPSMLQDLSNNGCGINMPLQLTSWGALVKKYRALG